MGKRIIIGILSCVFIFNVCGEDSCSYINSRKECEAKMFDSERKVYSSAEKNEKVLLALRNSKYAGDKNLQLQFIQILNIHNWEISNFEYLFNTAPDITLQELISILHYGDGGWWEPLLKPKFSEVFKTDELIKDINNKFENLIPYKKWIKEFVFWQENSYSNYCNYKIVKPIFKMFVFYEKRLKLEKELLEPQYLQSDLPQKSSRPFYDFLCSQSKLVENEKIRQALFELYDYILKSGILNLDLENSQWSVESVIIFLGNYIEDGKKFKKVYSPYAEELVKMAITLNIKEYVLEEFIFKLPSLSFIPKAAKALNFVVPFLECPCTEDELNDLYIIVDKYYKRFPNSEDVSDEIGYILKKKKTGIAKMIDELKKHLKEKNDIL
ncbi:uncharacterized protein LOC142332703 [Lycorma delicatula]|uniref:uncharacterized protein LOC142332703 n=1 Tax=Lycorma delicatula TaxID=130591 RepID=UPI003F50F9B6